MLLTEKFWSVQKTMHGDVEGLLRVNVQVPQVAPPRPPCRVEL